MLVAAWCGPCDFRGNSFLSDNPAGVHRGLEQGEFSYVRPPLLQDGLDEQCMSWQEVVSADSLHPWQKTRILSTLCH